MSSFLLTSQVWFLQFIFGSSICRAEGGVKRQMSVFTGTALLWYNLKQNEAESTSVESRKRDFVNVTQKKTVTKT